LKINITWFVCLLVGLTCGYFLQEGVVLTILWIVVVVVAIFLALVIIAVITAKEGVKLVRELFS